MKKGKIYLLIILVVFVIAIGVIFFVNKNITSGFQKSTYKKIELVKNTIRDEGIYDTYFPFEDKNKKYILLACRISSYNDPEKSSMEIKNVNYRNGDLIIELKINVVRKNL